MKTKMPKIGIILVSPPRFHDLGVGTKNGPYSERKEKVAKELLTHFDYAKTIFPGIIYSKEDMEKAIIQMKSEDVDMIFTHFLSWADDFAWVRFLRDIGDMPIMYATIVRDKLGFENSFTEDSFIEFLTAGGLVGSLEGSGDIARLKKGQVKIVLGSKEEVMSACKEMAQICALRHELRHRSIALLPSFNEAMWSTYVDPYDIFTKIGPEIRFLSIVELSEIMDAIDDEECNKLTKDILSKYEVKGTIDEEKMAASVKGSLALEKIARKYDSELLVLNDIDKVLQRTIGLRPGFTPCPGTDDVLVVPEGDIGAGLCAYILKKLTSQHVSFIEPFHIDAQTGTFAAGHAGPNDYTDELGKTMIATDTRFAKSNLKYAGAPFANHVFSPGEKTMIHLSENNGRFKLVATTVEVLESNHFLDGYSHGLFKHHMPVNEFFQKLLEIGVTQHYAITAGNLLSKMRLLAEIMGFDYYEI